MGGSNSVPNSISNAREVCFDNHAGFVLQAKINGNACSNLEQQNRDVLTSSACFDLRQCQDINDGDIVEASTEGGGFRSNTFKVRFQQFAPKRYYRVDGTVSFVDLLIMFLLRSIVLITCIYSSITCNATQTELFDIKEQTDVTDTSLPGDSCTKDYCYAYVYEPKVQNVAHTICQKNQGDLVSIHSSAENDMVQHVANYGNGGITGNAWIGYTNDGTDCGACFGSEAGRSSAACFEWTDESNVEYLDWGENQPAFAEDIPSNQFGSIESVVSIDVASGEWFDEYRGLSSWNAVCKIARSKIGDGFVFQP